MSLFDRFIELGKESSHSEGIFVPECKDSIQTAAAAMSIVEAGIEANALSGLSERLESLPTSDIIQDDYVFENTDKNKHLLTIAFSCVFSLIFGLLLFIGLNTALLTKLFGLLAIGMAAVSAVVLLINIYIIVAEIRTLRYQFRYNHYFNHLRFHRIEAVDDISEITGFKKPLVIRDLHRAVQKKFIPEGHFGRNDFLFMVSDEIYDGYQAQPAVYEHYFMEKIEERERMKGHNANTQRILETGKSYIEKIHDSNDLIKDKAVTEKLNQMEKTVSMIFKEVDLHPQQSEKLGLFLNYYLPTTDKLLKSYINIGEQGTVSKSLSNALLELSRSLDTINTAFEKILEMLYQEQEADILGDIETMRAMMTGEGLVDSN